MNTALDLNITPPLHSVYSASSSSRWLACAGSIRMSKNCEDQTNPQAELGTAAHELGEWCLKTGLNAFDFIGMKFYDHIVDDRMASGVQLYVSFIRDLCRRHNVIPMLEKRVVMLSVGEDVYGTADCIVIVGNHLFVIDYKNGYGVVEVVDNPQALFYVIATLDTLGLWQSIRKVTVGIVQPNSDHIDGTIRTADYTIEQIYQWQTIFRNGVALAKRKDAPLVAGKHCKYCPARGFCRPRIMRSLELIYSDKPIDEMNADEIALIYDELDVIKTNMEAVEGRTLALARAGKNIEGYKLVKSIQRASCKDEDGFVKAAVEAGVDEAKLFRKKLRSMTDCKKLMKDNIGIVNKYFVKPPESTTLVPMNNSRAAVSTNSAKGIFSPVNQKPAPSAAGIFKGVQA